MFLWKTITHIQSNDIDIYTNIIQVKENTHTQTNDREIQIDTNATKRFCGMLKGLLKAIKIIQTFEGKQNHSND